MRNSSEGFSTPSPIFATYSTSIPFNTPPSFSFLIIIPSVPSITPPITNPSFTHLFTLIITKCHLNTTLLLPFPPSLLTRHLQALILTLYSRTRCLCLCPWTSPATFEPMGHRSFQYRAQLHHSAASLIRHPIVASLMKGASVDCCRHGIEIERKRERMGG